MDINTKEATKLSNYIDFVKEQEITAVYYNKVSAISLPIITLFFTVFFNLKNLLPTSLTFITILMSLFSILFWIFIVQSGSKIYLAMVMSILELGALLYCVIYYISKFVFELQVINLILMLNLLFFIVYGLIFYNKFKKNFFSGEVDKLKHRQKFDKTLIIPATITICVFEIIIVSSKNNTLIAVLISIIDLFCIFSNVDIVKICVENYFRYYIICKHNLFNEIEL